MEKMTLYTIVFYKDGTFSMVSSICFRTRDMAESFAKAFCESRVDGSLWSYDIEE